MREQLNQNTLDFTIGTSVGIIALGRDGINLINEDDRWGILLSHPENITDEPRALSKELLDKLGTNHSNDASVGVMCHSLRQHGLARAWWAV